MERPYFARVSAPTSSHDTAPLLNSYSPPSKLSNIDPKPYTDINSSASSPPPSFRALSPTNSDIPPPFLDSRSSSYRDNLRLANSPSPSRTRVSQAYNSYGYNGSENVQALGIPPPITQSMLVPQYIPATSSRSRSTNDTHSISPSRSRIRFSNQNSRPESSSQSRSPTKSIYTYPPVPQRRPAPSYITGILREEKAIQKEVQALLDAQAAGLAKGSLGGDAESDAGSNTPTSQSIFLNGASSQQSGNSGGGIPSGVVPIRQPKPKKISLRGARRGITAALRDLEGLKSKQRQIIEGSLAQIKETQTLLKSWETSTVEFEKEIKSIDSGPENNEIHELTTERSAVQNEIRELEDRLLALKAKEGYLERNVTELKNKQSAKLSSFVEGKKAVTSDVARFLQRPGPEIEDAASLVIALPPPLRHGSANESVDASNPEETTLFLDLPPKRRTAEMATSFLTHTSTALGTISKSTDKEISALQAGAKLWAETLERVQGFEDGMRAQMKSNAQAGGTEVLKGQISNMDFVIGQLEENLAIAEKEGWNLLLCAIGAELEAFREGRNLLISVLQQLEPPLSANEHDVFADGDGNGDGDDETLVQSVVRTTSEKGKAVEGGQQVATEGGSNGLQELVDTPKSPRPELQQSTHQEDTQVQPRREENSESEDDGPHPDLLTEIEADD